MIKEVSHTEVNGTSSGGKIASLPLMTCSFSLGRDSGTTRNLTPIGLAITIGHIGLMSTIEHIGLMSTIRYVGE